MNETERDRIAGAINQLRPDWPTASLRTLLERPKLASRARRDVAIALTWVACDSASKNPGRVLQEGPWWTAAASDETTGGAPRVPFDPTSSCDECSQPAHRHGPTSGHDFISVIDANRRRDAAPKPRLPRARQETTE